MQLYFIHILYKILKLISLVIFLTKTIYFLLFQFLHIVERQETSIMVAALLLFDLYA
jgi:hypothetical protein